MFDKYKKAFIELYTFLHHVVPNGLSNCEAGEAVLKSIEEFDEKYGHLYEKLYDQAEIQDLPSCPECGTIVTEHENNTCFHSWFDFLPLSIMLKKMDASLYPWQDGWRATTWINYMLCKTYDEDPDIAMAKLYLIWREYNDASC